ncbi:MAG: peptidoglycan-associated lipoprotein Pal [Rhizobacter sp.]
MNKHFNTAWVISTVALFAACSNTPVAPPASSQAAVPSASTTSPSPAAQSGATQSSTVATVTLAPHLDPSSLISKERSVYFEFDDFTIKQQYVDLIQRHGSYLSSKPALTVKIEGNCDERGGAEYNLALGQKRAEAVKAALKIAGGRDGQMEAVSWGHERPKALGHDEAAWAQNRRADIVYPQQ